MEFFSAIFFGASIAAASYRSLNQNDIFLSVRKKLLILGKKKKRRIEKNTSVSHQRFASGQCILREFSTPKTLQCTPSVLSFVVFVVKR